MEKEADQLPRLNDANPSGGATAGPLRAGGPGRAASLLPTD